MKVKRVHSAGVNKAKVVYSDDFETTTREPDIRVWLWGSVEVDRTDPESTFKWGKDIDSYFDHIQKHNSLRFFFNLKFDGGFIISRLLNLGFEFIENERQDGLQKGQFTALISNMNKFYSIKVKWQNGHITEWNDAAKKFSAGMTVAGLAKVYGAPEEKGSIDYHKERPVGYEPTEEELKYQLDDVVIVATALKQTRDAGMKRLTIGSDSLADYKAMSGGEKAFRRRFPVLGHAMDSEIRRAYRGGFTYRDPRYAAKRTGPGIVLDVNSLYPHVMYSAVIPYGEPEYVSGEVTKTATRPCLIFSVTFTAKLKKNHIPCIQIKGSVLFGATEYLSKIDDPVTLMVTDVDWDLWNEHYDIFVLSYNGGWRFRGAVGMFGDYIDKWMAVKAESTGGKRDIAKLHLNSPYGKLASNPSITGKIPYLDEEGTVKYRRGMDQKKAPVYTAAGVFITAYARALTIRAAQTQYQYFAYADTDSLHLVGVFAPEEAHRLDKIGDYAGNVAGLEVHPSKLGAWKLEYEFEEAMFVRAKFYMERKTNGEYHVAAAGLTAKQTAGLTFDDLWEGNVIGGKLEPFNVPGGIVLREKTWTVKLQKV